MQADLKMIHMVKHSSKEVQQFLYNEKGVQALGKILGKTVKTA